MTKLRWFLISFMLTGVVTLPAVAEKRAVAQKSTVAQRRTPEEEATQFVKDRQADLFKAIREKANADIEKTFDEMLDYDKLARETLRDSWAALKPPEREQFQCVLRGLVTDAHRKNLSKTLGYEITFQGTTKTNGGFLVTTSAQNTKNRREEPITIAYSVRKQDKKWLVEDIITEGSSLVDNYRNQFRRIMKKDGFGELLRRMKKKLGKAGEKC